MARSVVIIMVMVVIVPMVVVVMMMMVVVVMLVAVRRFAVDKIPVRHTQFATAIAHVGLICNNVSNNYIHNNYSYYKITHVIL